MMDDVCLIFLTLFRKQSEKKTKTKVNKTKQKKNIRLNVIQNFSILLSQNCGCTLTSICAFLLAVVSQSALTAGKRLVISDIYSPSGRPIHLAYAWLMDSISAPEELPVNQAPLISQTERNDAFQFRSWTCVCLCMHFMSKWLNVFQVNVGESLMLLDSVEVPFFRLFKGLQRVYTANVKNRGCQSVAANYSNSLWREAEKLRDPLGCASKTKASEKMINRDVDLFGQISEPLWWLRWKNIKVSYIRGTRGQKLTDGKVFFSHLLNNSETSWDEIALEKVIVLSWHEIESERNRERDSTALRLW